MRPAIATRLRALRVVHPFPSFLNAGLVGVLAYLAANDGGRAISLATAMLGLQFAIGATNDVVDVERDALTKPDKPIPAGAVSIRGATAVALVSAVVGLALASLSGPVTVGLWVAMLACGIVYDLWLKPTPVAWACFSVAFALLPLYAWYGASGQLPPRWEFLVLLAAAAGPAIQLANGLVDIDLDRAAGVPTLATRLGRGRALVVMGSVLVAIHAAAWATVASDSTGPLAIVGAASITSLMAFAMSAGSSDRSRAWGWTLQAVALALLGAGWLAAVAGVG